MTEQDYIALIDSYGGHFTPGEFRIQGGMDKMDSGFLRTFLAWRQWHGLTTMISSAWRDGNTTAHGQGMAIDCLLFESWRQEQASPLQHWLLATTWPFRGVGLYFDWRYSNTNGEPVSAIGVHVDSWQGNAPSQRPLRWLRIDGLYYYQSVTSGAFTCRTNQKTITLETVTRDYLNEQNAA